MKKPTKRLTIKDGEIIFHRSNLSAQSFNTKVMGFHLMVTTGIITKPNSRYVRLYFADGRARFKSGRLPIYVTKIVYKMNGITPLRMIKIAKIIALQLKDIEPSNVKKIKQIALKVQ